MAPPLVARVKAVFKRGLSNRNVLTVAIVVGIVLVLIAAGVLLYAARNTRLVLSILHYLDPSKKAPSGIIGTLPWKTLGTPKMPVEQQRLWLSLGSQILDALPKLFDGSPNPDFDKTSPYQQLMTASISTTPLPCAQGDIQRAQFLAYFQAVYPKATRFANMTTAQLQAAYRTLKWIYIVAPEDQPDGGFSGPYWSQRVVPGNDHNQKTGCTTTTARANMGLLFDEIRAGGSKGAKSRSNYWGQAIFLESHQASMRRGMRNSRQVLEQNPVWATNGQGWRYGNGGFPEFSYVETSQFPEEHALSGANAGQQAGGYGYPTACDAAAVVSNKAPGASWFKCPPGYKGNCTDLTKPLYQPPYNEQDWGPNYKGPSKPIWLYYDRGFGLFRNMGRILYMYSYVDFFLNAPKGLGWGPYDFAGAEHDPNDPVYSVKLILEYLSRVAVTGGCTDTSNPSGPVKHVAPLDSRTGRPGLGYCESPCSCFPGANNCPTAQPCTTDSVSNASCCSAEAIARGKSIGTSLSLDKQVAALMGVASYWAPYTATPTAPSTWPAASIKTSATPAPVYAKRQLGETKRVDNRYLVTGWVNGHFYGFPKQDCLCTSASDCARKSTTTPTRSGEMPTKCTACNAYRGTGLPGLDPITGEIIYGKQFTEQDPLQYFDANGNVIYETWGGKPLAMDEPTALALIAEMYSCGDTGAENSGYNFPFGCYFSFGQDLGGPGKNACVQSANANPGFAITTWHFTATPLSYDAETAPAYDYEILLAQFNQGDYMPEGTCECGMAVTLDITADDEDFRTWACSNGGSTGGYVMVNSKAGQTAVPFKGTDMGVSNYTTLQPPAFDYSKPNVISGKSNVLNAKSLCS
jgi:hypothetical protein